MATAIQQIDPSYHWDEEEGEFVDDQGNPVDKRALLLLLLLLIGHAKKQARRVTQKYIFGQITVDEWYSGMLVVIESMASTTAVMVFGGVENAQRNAALIQDLIDGQEVFLKRFAQQVSDGEIASGRGMLARAEQYAESAYAMYEQMRRQRIIDSGGNWEKRVLDESAVHCAGCLDAADEGWQPIGTLPEVGSTECSTGCKCEFVYSDSETKPSESEDGDLGEE